MNLNEFNQKPGKKIQKLNKFLKEQFNVSVGKKLPTLTKLNKIVEAADTAIIKLRTSNKKFHLEPEYAKFLGLRDIAETMLREGVYANSRGHQEMVSMINSCARGLLDSGYTDDEAHVECLKQYRLDDRFAFDEDYVIPIITRAIEEYMNEGTESLNTKLGPDEEYIDELGTDLDDGVEEVEEDFADCFDCAGTGISDHGDSCGACMGTGYAHDDFGIAADADTNEWDLDQLTEGVNIEEAEVVMATRAMSSAIQDHIEKVGRMINEDIPAIADQVQSEMGRETSRSYAENVTELLNTYIDACRTAKDGLDQAIAILSGDESAAAPVDTPDPEMGDELPPAPRRPQNPLGRNKV